MTAAAVSEFQHKLTQLYNRARRSATCAVMMIIVRSCMQLRMKIKNQKYCIRDESQNKRKHETYEMKLDESEKKNNE